ncbi:MAG: trigger factor [Microgenomates group bacterium]
MTTNTPVFTPNPDKTFVIKATFTVPTIDKQYQKVLTSAQSNMDIKGFRKGKAPLDMVKDRLHDHVLIEETLTGLITTMYGEIIKTNHLHPIIQPQLKIVNPPLTLDKEWQIEVTGCELPEIKLSDKYQDEIKKINKAAKDDNDRLNQTISCLLKSSTVDLPEILVKNDVENKLSQLVDQTEQAGLTVQAYLKSKNTTLDQYKKDLETQIHQEWITNLAIDNIAKTNKIDVSQAEVDDIISKNKDMAKNLNLVYYLLTQQKVFQFLKNL